MQATASPSAPSTDRYDDLLEYLKQLPDPYCPSRTPAMLEWFPLLPDIPYVEVYHPPESFITYSFERCVKCGKHKDPHPADDIVRGYYCDPCAMLFRRVLDIGGIPLNDLYGKLNDEPGTQYRQRYIDEIKKLRKERYPQSKCKSDADADMKEVEQ